MNIGKFFKKLAPIALGAGGFMLGGPAGAALGAGLGTGVARGFKGTGIGTRMLQGGLAGYGAGAGLAGLGGMMGGSLGQGLTQGGMFGMPGGNPLGSIFGNMFGGQGGGMSGFGQKAGMMGGGYGGGGYGGGGYGGGGYGGGGSPNWMHMLFGGGGILGNQGLPGLAGMALGAQGQNQAGQRLGHFQDIQSGLLGQAGQYGGFAPGAFDARLNQAREGISSAQAERGIYNSGVGAQAQAEQMPLIEQQLRMQQMQAMLGLAGGYNPLLQSQMGMFGAYQ